MKKIFILLYLFFAFTIYSANLIDLKNYIKELKKYPNNLELLELVGKEFFELKKYNKALKYFNRYLKIKPYEYKIRYYVAIIKFKQKKYKEAKEEAEIVLSSNDISFEKKRRMKKILYKIKKYYSQFYTKDEILKKYKIELYDAKNCKKNIELIIDKIQQYYKEFNKPLHFTKNTIKIFKDTNYLSSDISCKDKEYFMYKNEKGMWDIKCPNHGNLDDCIEYIHKIEKKIEDIEKDPKELYKKESVTNFEVTDKKSAISTFMRENIESKKYNKKKKLTKIELLKKKLEKHPNSSKYIYDLAYEYLMKNNIQEAEKYIEKLISRKRKSNRYIMLEAYLNYKKLEIYKTIRNLKYILKKDSEYSEAKDLYIKIKSNKKLMRIYKVQKLLYSENIEKMKKALKEAELFKRRYPNDEYRFFLIATVYLKLASVSTEKQEEIENLMFAKNYLEKSKMIQIDSGGIIAKLTQKYYDITLNLIENSKK